MLPCFLLTLTVRRTFSTFATHPPTSTSIHNIHTYNWLVGRQVGTCPPRAQAARCKRGLGSGSGSRGSWHNRTGDTEGARWCGVDVMVR
ncbi:hypothetical protein B0T11DRAFT_281126 [Plectosphaerella cucumerina]|uniref:Secreted protein n=1 Tax=Plectosphaerella cucumerina TaxID=40658 RepID=A0A8K0TLW9_9PEZI|nr:hypothetical protein B0T11DRAFT_281126 [Plectosphaerella cucumerina]